MDDVSVWLGAAWSEMGWVVAGAVGIYLVVIAFTRAAGLRSFAKMSSFDFAATVAVGSSIATVMLTRSVSLARGIVALATLYGMQWMIATLRRRIGWVKKAVDNDPLLLMAGPDVLGDHLEHGRVSHSDLVAKLREANVNDLRQIRAVILESTGDISVLHGDVGGPGLDPALLEGVRGAERLGDDQRLPPKDRTPLTA